MNIKLLVAHHKKSVLIENDIYLPIHVGKSCSNVSLDIIGDNSGDNISHKNSIYCEMTAIYWGWKNLKADYIGLCHYRRYFTFDKKSFKSRIIDTLRYYKTRCIGNIFNPGTNYAKNGQINIADKNIFEKKSIIFSEIIKEKINKKRFDAIVPMPYLFACRNVRQFFEVLGREHISLICDIVSEISPALYPYLQKTFMSNKLYAANMFIMKSEIYNDYCNTIFPILFEHEKRTLEKGWCNDLIVEKAYSRLSGYFAEFLTSAYILKLISEKKSILFVNTMFYSN